MANTIRCSNCGAVYEVCADLEGKRVRCGQCNTSFSVPAQGQDDQVESTPPPAAPPVAIQPPPVAAAEQWHLYTDQKTYGPMAKAELDRWVAEGLVDSQAQVFCEGWPQWRLASEIYPELVQQAGGHETITTGEPPGYSSTTVRAAQRDAYVVRSQSDAAGVASLIFGILAVVLTLMGCLVGCTVYIAPFFAVLGLVLALFARGNLKVAGLLLNFLALIPALLVLFFILSIAGAVNQMTP